MSHIIEKATVSGVTRNYGKRISRQYCPMAAKGNNFSYGTPVDCYSQSFAILDPTKYLADSVSQITNRYQVIHKIIVAHMTTYE